jgi:hypothetical protein
MPLATGHIPMIEIKELPVLYAIHAIDKLAGLAGFS